MKVAYLNYQTNKKGKCNVCNGVRRLTTLFLLHDAHDVFGDLVVCDDCRSVLEEAFMQSVQVEQEWQFN